MSDEAQTNNPIETDTSLRLKMQVRFNQPVTVYALQIGGWLPLAFTSCRMLLVDRNIVSTLKAITRGSVRGDHTANKWWFDFLNSSNFTINPVLYAMESAGQRLPSFDEFCSSFDEACSQLSTSFPTANVIKYGELHYRAAYESVVEFGDRYSRERDFLRRVAPLIYLRRAKSELASLEARILEEASNIGN